MRSRKHIGALVLLGAGGILYMAGSASTPSGELPLQAQSLKTKTYAARPALQQAAVQQAPADECAGSELCAGPRVAVAEAAKQEQQSAPAARAPAAAVPERPQRETARTAAPGRASAIDAPKMVAKATAAARMGEATAGATPAGKVLPRAERHETARADLDQVKPASPAARQDFQLGGREPAPRETAPDATAQEQRAPQRSNLVGRFQNRVGSSYELQRITCLLDGTPVYSGSSAGVVELFRRGIAPGAHELSVIAEYRGSSGGVFSYANGFRFTLQGAERFNVGPGQPAQVIVTAFERGGPSTPMGKRLGLSISAR
jgi:hypothetical protein